MKFFSTKGGEDKAMSLVAENQSLMELEPLLRSRLFGYDLLRRTFLEEPTKGFLESLCDEQTQVIEVFPFRTELTEIEEGAEQVALFLGKFDVNDKADFDRLHWDYTRLFIGPHEVPTPPWESAYLSEEHLLFQVETLRVRKAYRKYAFIPVNYGHEADDHLGLELDFMYQLCKLSLENLGNQDLGNLLDVLKDQREFMEEHLLKWIPTLCKDIVLHAQTEFYQGMAKLLKGFLEVDRRAIEELLDEI